MKPCPRSLSRPDRPLVAPEIGPPEAPLQHASGRCLLLAPSPWGEGWGEGRAPPRAFSTGFARGASSLKNHRKSLFRGEPFDRAAALPRSTPHPSPLPKEREPVLTKPPRSERRSGGFPRQPCSSPPEVGDVPRPGHPDRRATHGASLARQGRSHHRHPAKRHNRRWHAPGPRCERRRNHQSRQSRTLSRRIQERSPWSDRYSRYRPRRSRRTARAPTPGSLQGSPLRSGRSSSDSPLTARHDLSRLVPSVNQKISRQGAKPQRNPSRSLMSSLRAWRLCVDLVLRIRESLLGSRPRLGAPCASATGHAVAPLVREPLRVLIQ